MEQYINLDNVAYIEVREKKPAERFEYSKAKSEKWTAFFKSKIEQEEGWFDDDGKFYSREDLSKSFKGKFGIDTDGQTVIVRPRVEIELTTQRIITKYFDDYQQARMFAVELTQQSRNLIKFS